MPSLELEVFIAWDAFTEIMDIITSVSVSNCFAETFPGLNKSINTKYSQESIVTHPLKANDLQYGLYNPFNSTNLVSDIVEHIHFDRNNNYKKIQVLGSSHHRSSKNQESYI